MKDKEQQRQEAGPRSQLGNSSCPPALLIRNVDDSWLRSKQMLTWLTETYAKLNLSMPLHPVLEKMKTDRLLYLDTWIALFSTGRKE